MYEIVQEEAGPGGALYALRAVGSSIPVYHESFLRELRSNPCAAADHDTCVRYNKTCGLHTCRRRERLQALVDRLEGATEGQGFTPDLFRDLHKYRHVFPIAALDASPFRLLGLRYGDGLFVAVDLGFKRAKRLQEDPVLGPVFERTVRLNAALGEAERSGALSFLPSSSDLTRPDFSLPFIFPG